MVEQDTSGLPEHYTVLCRPNRSLSMMATVYAFLAIALVVGVIGVAFARIGAWPVLVYAMIVVTALRLGFQQVWRHVDDYERLMIEQEKLLIETCELGICKRFEFNRYWAALRLEQSAGYGARLMVRSHGQEVEFGRHMTAMQRQDTEKQLNSLLGNAAR